MPRACRSRALASAATVGLTLAGALAASAGELDFALGRALFTRAWVPAPSSTRANDGLGPLYNARSCVSCHEGLARAPVTVGSDGVIAGDHLVLRLSDAAGRPDPVYGAQVQPAGVPGVPPEARPVRIDGRVGLAEPAYGPLSEGTRVGARLAPPLRGLGLLEGVPETAVLAVAEEQAKGHDGVRGRPNWITGLEGVRRLGRFGSKASAATLREQAETAFALDLGLSTPGLPHAEGDCTPAQAACRAAPHGGALDRPEIPVELVTLLARFLAGLDPPQPAAPNRVGARLFARTGCAACHRPELPSPAGPVRAFTDLLLHDLGPELDGGATEPGVASTEWRTTPLWGLERTLANGAGLLYDGRARTVADAIALHGGEASASRARFLALPEADRRRLLAYVGSL